MNVYDDAGWAQESDRGGYGWRRKRIAGELLAASLYELPVGERTWPYHYEEGHEEWLLVVSGAPVLRTPDGERELAPGDCFAFRSGPEGAHQLRGPGRVLLVSNWGTLPRAAVYPDSDKLRLRLGPQEDDVLHFRRGDAVDYWDDEA